MAHRGRPTVEIILERRMQTRQRRNAERVIARRRGIGPAVPNRVACAEGDRTHAEIAAELAGIRHGGVAPPFRGRIVAMDSSTHGGRARFARSAAW